MATETVQQIQEFIAETLRQEGVTVEYYGNKLEISEIIALDGGLPKLLQQALLFDLSKKSNYLWGSGFTIVEDNNTLTGHAVSYEPPEQIHGKYPLFALLSNSVDIGIQATDKHSTIDLGYLPILPVPSFMSNLQTAIDWHSLKEVLEKKESEYKDTISLSPQP